MRIPITQALSELEALGVTIYPREQHSSDLDKIRMSAPAPAPPFSRGQTLRYVLTLDKDQQDIDSEEFDAAKRAMWHGSS